jgi:hypothetical protein
MSYTITRNKKLHLAPSSIGMSAKTIANGSDVTSSVIDCIDWNKMDISMNATRAAYTEIHFYVEFSDDNSTWYRENTESISAGTASLAAKTYSRTTSSSAQMSAYNIDISRRYVRITMGSTNGTTDVSDLDVVLSEL